MAMCGPWRVPADPNNAHARVLQLTRAGKKLMLDSLEVMAELEQRYSGSIGQDRLVAILGGLSDFVEEAEQD